MKKYFLLLVLIFICLTSLKAQDQNPILAGKFYMDIGVFIPSNEIKLGADGSTPNDEIDFGETFKLTDNQNTFFTNFEWKFSKKWKFTAEYFGFNNGNRVTLEEDLEFDDVIVEKGTNVRAGIEFNLLRIFFGRVISQGHKHSLGAGLGVHGLNVGAFVEGELKTSEGNIEFDRRDVSALIPLPNIGAWYYWSPGYKWLLTARLDWFGLSIDQYSGSLWNITPGVKFQIIDNLGIGANYRMFLLNAKVSETNWKGAFDMNFTGPSFTIFGNF